MFHRLCVAYGIGNDLVKSASAEALAGTEEANRNQYADYAYRMFYCGNAASVKASAVYFFAQKTTLEHDRAEAIERRLKEAAVHFGVKGDVDTISRAVEAKQAGHEAELPDDYFMFLWQADDGSKVRRYPMRNPLECVKAAEYLCGNSKEFTFPDRCSMSSRLLSKVADLGFALPDPVFDRLLRMAGQGTCSAKTAAEYVFDRAKMLRIAGADVGIQEKVAMLAQSLLDDGETARLPSTLRKVASLTDAVDRKYNLNLEPPEDVLFMLTVKSAARFRDNHVFLSSGAVYDSNDFSKLPLHMFRQAAGDKIADDMSTAGLYVNIHKASAVLSKAPVAVGEMIEKMASEAGVTPKYRGTAAPLRLEQSVLRELNLAHVNNPTGIPEIV